MKKYIVINFDYEELGTFKTKKEAQQFIKELKAFDKRHENPFDENYQIVEEE